MAAGWRPSTGVCMCAPRTRSWSGLVAALLVFAGCSSAAESPVSMEQYPDALRRALCRGAVECAFADGSGAYDRAEHNDQDGCTYGATSQTSVVDLRILRRVEEGTVVYSAEGAAACLRATEATCQYGTESVRRACNSVYQGQVANGGSCRHDLECRSGLCGRGANFCGGCSSLGTLGNPCLLGECHTTLDEPLHCENDFCLAGTGPTADLGDAGPGDPCTDPICGQGLYCLDGLCVAWERAGEACDEGHDSCEPGTLCRLPTIEATENRCVPYRVETTPGEPCGDPNAARVGEYVVCDASAGLRCALGVCAAGAMDGEDGVGCERHDDCVDGLRCVDGWCADGAHPDGDSCQGDGQCESLYCAWSPGTFDRRCGSEPVCD